VPLNTYGKAGIKDEELVGGAQRSTMMILTNWVKEADRVVTF